MGKNGHQKPARAVRRSMSPILSVQTRHIPSIVRLALFVHAEIFRTTYQEALGAIVLEHGSGGSLHLFPAVPAPVAVLCGRELLPKAHPELRVYDFDAAKGGFQFQLTVNNHDN